MEILFEAIEHEGKNVFVTGRAGTGKSTFLMALKQRTRKHYAVLAPTGVAALHVKGQTIHSFFKFRPRLMDMQQVKLVPLKERKLYQKLELLIIDEISMVRADVFDAIEQFLYLNGPVPGTPFGGVQICVIGDLFQLPPVVGAQEREVYFQRYRSVFFFSAPAFELAHFDMIELTTVYRQLNRSCVDLLNRVREGEASVTLLSNLNQKMFRIKHQEALLPDEEAIVLTTTNNLADRINHVRLEQLSGMTYSYIATISGDFLDMGDKLPAPQELRLKAGAQVMFTRNDVKNGLSPRWVNGTVGIVTALDEKTIEVAVMHNAYRKYHLVEKEEWENIRYGYDQEKDTIEEKTVGTYCQYPLIHAWAITIHKSQGKTLDRMTLDLGHGAFAPGQLYVALSRCRSLEDITLCRPIKSGDVRCDPTVVRFYRQWAEM